MTALVLVLLLGAAILVSCSPAASRSQQLQLRTLNDSGVTGSVTLTETGDSRTLVEVAADPAGHPSMPAHIHPGTCDELVPQPKYPLENVVDGVSVTELAVPFDELMLGGVALNIHSANDDLATYTACVELGDS